MQEAQTVKLSNVSVYVCCCVVCCAVAIVSLALQANLLKSYKFVPSNEYLLQYADCMNKPVWLER